MENARPASSQPTHAKPSTEAPAAASRTSTPGAPVEWSTPDLRRTHISWLLELTSTPSAAGRERRVEAWIERWARQRPGVILSRDAVGNITLALADEPVPPSDAAPTDRVPLYITAHMDHPAFVVEHAAGEGRFEASFRGGVMDAYFADATVVIHPVDDHRASASPAVSVRARVERRVEGVEGPFKRWLLRAEPGEPWRDVAVGDVAVWDVGAPCVRDGKVWTLACDDLSAAAAALAAFDVLRILDEHARRDGRRAFARPVRLFFTRAEEVGFIGALAAVRDTSVPRDARVLLLENSRSFADSPLHAGPIVRVGDRISIFSPRLTDAVARRAEELSGGPATPRATERDSDRPWKWQRKLMVGGACEASVFCAAGYEATCICLALGNYHNMSDLAEVQAGSFAGTPRVAHEFIGLDDFEGLVDLLVACGVHLPAGGLPKDRFDALWREASHVLT